METGRYQIEALAGEGGMGAVYRALDTQSGSHVALKALHKRGEREREMMRREAELLASVQHPGVVRYLEQGETQDGTMYVVLEWLEGEDLEHLLARQKRLSVEDTLRLAKRVASALSQVHSCGIVHRDIKPSNLFLPQGDLSQTKIVDFGIARGTRTKTLIAEAHKGQIAIVGTLGYMAPEQARGEKKLGPAADIFSLGCVLFRCLTGQEPFDGEHEIAILAKILLDDAPRLRALQPDIPEEVEALVSWMLRKKVEERPQDGAELLRLLEELEEALLSPAKDFEEKTVLDGPLPPRAPSLLTEREQGLFCVLLLGAEAEPEAPSPVHTIEVLQRTLSSADVFYSHSAPATLILSEEREKTMGGALESTYSGTTLSLQRRLQAEVEPFLGKVEVLADGSVLVFFTGSVATDMAQRAARCALALQRSVQRKIAIATGRAEVTARWPVGEVIERAALLLGNSETPEKTEGQEGETSGPIPHSPFPIPSPSMPLLDEVTAGLLGARFEVLSEGERLCLVGEQDALQPARTLLGKATPCVGREYELAFLYERINLCAKQRRSTSLLVEAPAGMGKSRLRDELLQRLSQGPYKPRVLVGIGEEPEQEKPFAVLAPALRRACGLSEAGTPKENQKKLSARLGRSMAPHKLARIEIFLGEMLGLSAPEESPILLAARRDPVLMGDQIRRAFEDWVEAESATRLFVIVLEDLHWCDGATLSLVEGVLTRLSAYPLVVLGFSRPLQDSRAQRIFSQKISLSALSVEAVRALARAVLGEDFPDAERLWEHSLGNAFYLEELLRFAAMGRGEALPETVLAMVQARLGALEEEERRFLRAASVFGQSFWPGGVSALLGEAPRYEVLSRLIDAEIIEAQPVSRFSQERELRFRHSLLREGAYASLTEADKTTGHRGAGEWLAEAGETNAASLAEHFVKGELPQKAIVSYRRAAEQALEGGDLTGALSLASKGVSLGAQSEERGALRLTEAVAYNWRAEFNAAASSAKEALSLLPVGGELWCSAAAEAAVAYGRTGQGALLEELGKVLVSLGQRGEQGAFYLTAAARSVARLILSGRSQVALELLSVLEKIGQAQDLAASAWLSVARAASAILQGDLPRYLFHMKAAVASFEAIGDRRNACMQQIDVSFALILLGEYQQARRTCTEILQTSQELGLGRVEALAYLYLAQALTALGALGEGVSTAQKAIEALCAQKDTQTQGAAHTELAILLMRANQLERAEEELTKALSLMVPTYPFRPKALATFAQLRRMQERFQEALSLAQEALSLIKEGRDFVEVFVRYVHAEALLELNRKDEAKEALSIAKERLLARASRMEDPAQRRRFLEKVPENQQLLVLALSFGL